MYIGVHSTFAVRLFPKNINVSALLSISGLGSHETIVKIIADPNTTKNTHEITARGKFGQISTKIENVPDFPDFIRILIRESVILLGNTPLQKFAKGGVFAKFSNMTDP